MHVGTKQIRTLQVLQTKCLQLLFRNELVVVVDILYILQEKNKYILM